MISTHTPLAGRDLKIESLADSIQISTHTPLAGRDGDGFRAVGHSRGFLLTRPLRGATRSALKRLLSCKISTHTPLAGRDK